MSRARSWLILSLLVVSMLVLAVGATGCSSGGSTGGSASTTPATDNSAKLQGKTWKATMIAGKTDLVRGFEVTAEFATGTVSGVASVNRYNGPYTAEPGNKITFGQMATTMMAGPEAAMKQEQAYLAAMTQAATYEVTDTTLTLLDATGATLVKYEVAQPTALEGTKWTATMYNNGKQALVSVSADSSITAVFGADGTLAGNASVNSYSTKYTTEGEKMTIDAKIVTTMKAGPDALMAQEAAYLAALPKTATYSVEGNELWLRDADGAALAVYTAE